MPAAAIPGLLIVRPDEMLFFANVTSVRDGILAGRRQTRSRAPRSSSLDLALTPEVDVPVGRGAGGPAPAPGRRRDRAVAEPPPARTRSDLLERAGALATIGPDRVHPRVIDGILAFALRTARAPRSGWPS